MALVDSPEIKKWVEIIDEYRWTGKRFEYAVWAPVAGAVHERDLAAKSQKVRKYWPALVWDGPGE